MEVVLVLDFLLFLEDHGRQRIFTMPCLAKKPKYMRDCTECTNYMDNKHRVGKLRHNPFGALAHPFRFFFLGVTQT